MRLPLPGLNSLRFATGPDARAQGTSAAAKGVPTRPAPQQGLAAATGRQLVCRFALMLLAALPLSVSAQEFIGVIHPLKDLTLSVRVNGVVSRVNVKLGQRVKAGQPLLELDSELQTLEVNRRRMLLEDTSELRSIEQRHEILSRLVGDANRLYEETGSISREELMKMRMELVSLEGRRDQIRIEKQRERNEFEMAQQERQMRVLTAPVTGTVTAINVDVGEWATPGEPSVRLVDDGVVEFRANIAQAAARTLALGRTLTVHIDDPSVRGAVNGRVTFLSPVADAASGLVEVRLTVANAERQLRPGAKGRIRLNGSAL